MAAGPPAEAGVAATDRHALLVALLTYGCATGGIDADAPDGDGLFVSRSDYTFMDDPPVTGSGPVVVEVDGGTQVVEPATASDVVISRSCRQLETFSQTVVPLFEEHCMSCHDGTKGKATKQLDLTGIRNGDLALACDITLSTTDEADPIGSSIFSENDPSDATTVHDFKFETAAAFNAYRDQVMAWLGSE